MPTFGTIPEMGVAFGDRSAADGILEEGDPYSKTSSLHWQQLTVRSEEASDDWFVEFHPMPSKVRLFTQLCIVDLSTASLR